MTYEQKDGKSTRAALTLLHSRELLVLGIRIFGLVSVLYIRLSDFSDLKFSVHSIFKKIRFGFGSIRFGFGS